MTTLTLVCFFCRKPIEGEPYAVLFNDKKVHVKCMNRVVEREEALTQ